MWRDWDETLGLRIPLVRDLIRHCPSSSADVRRSSSPKPPPTLISSHNPTAPRHHSISASSFPFPHSLKFHPTRALLPTFKLLTYALPRTRLPFLQTLRCRQYRSYSTSTMADYTKLAPASTDPRDETLVIRQPIPGMVTFSLPFVSHPLASSTHNFRLPRQCRCWYRGYLRGALSSSPCTILLAEYRCRSPEPKVGSELIGNRNGLVTSPLEDVRLRSAWTTARVAFLSTCRTRSRPRPKKHSSSSEVKSSG